MENKPGYGEDHPARVVLRRYMAANKNFELDDAIFTEGGLMSEGISDPGQGYFDHMEERGYDF